MPTEGWAVTVRPDAPPPVMSPVSVVAEVLYAIFCVARLVVGVGELIKTDTLLVLDEMVGAPVFRAT